MSNLSGMNGLGAPAGGGAAKPTPLLIRILMIGDSSVGKTSLVLRYDKRGFNLRFTTTIGVDYSDRLLELDGRQVKLQVCCKKLLLCVCSGRGKKKSSLGFLLLLLGEALVLRESLRRACTLWAGCSQGRRGSLSSCCGCPERPCRNQRWPAFDASIAIVRNEREG